jgi:CheY-like chemotaxis protein
MPVDPGEGGATGGAADLQLYKGHLRGHPDSWVRLGVISGQFYGMIWTPEEIYVFQPHSDLDPNASSMETVAYRGSDVDMPRMSGLQLVQAVRADDRLKQLPVVIVSYKEREEDRLNGLEAGANYYLTKSSFHDNKFLEAVTDLIGEI